MAKTQALNIAFVSACLGILNVFIAIVFDLHFLFIFPGAIFVTMNLVFLIIALGLALTEKEQKYFKC